MIAEKEITEYRKIHAVLTELETRYRLRKEELRLLFAKTAALRSRALCILVKANRLTKHLTGRQRQVVGLSYNLVEIEARITRHNPLVLYDDEGGYMPEMHNRQAPEDCKNIRELKQKELLVVSLIDRIRKKLLQIDILEMRCRELILSISKAIEAFCYESGVIRRKIYPYGVFSLLHRNIRRLLGSAYFSLGDMETLRALGNISGDVLKIADSPII